MAVGRISKLMAGEYPEFKSDVRLEAPFVETTRHSKGIGQVLLGITSEFFIVAVEKPLSNKKSAHVFYNAKFEGTIHSVEFQWVVPLCFINLSSKSIFCLNVECRWRQTRYFEMSNRVPRRRMWADWTAHVALLREESSAMTRTLRVKFGLQENTDMRISPVNRPVTHREPEPKKDTGLLKSLWNRVFHPKKPHFVTTSSPPYRPVNSILKYPNDFRYRVKEKKKHHVRFKNKPQKIPC